MPVQRRSRPGRHQKSARGEHGTVADESRTFRRDRVSSELPTKVLVGLLDAEKFNDALIDWERIAHAVALSAARVLLDHADAGWSTATYRRLMAHESMAVRAVAVKLCNRALIGQRWSMSDIVTVLLHWFGLKHGFRRLRDQLCNGSGNNLPQNIDRSA
jgi:hypothetical protein